MSRQAQLPPRCPLQRKSTPSQMYGSKDIELKPLQNGLHGSISDSSSVLEEQPAWLNDLLSDTDSNTNLTLHRRTASDSLTLFKELMPLQDLDQLDEENGLESSYMYGPNSPRSKNKLGLPDKEIVSAFSEYVMQNPVQVLDGEINAENKSIKRHPGQRSRARKLQYIAELERTVNVLQNMGSELGVRVASLVQQRTALSMENNTLKQRLLRMQQEKFLVDGEYQSLKKEVDKLKTCLAISRSNKGHNRSRSAANLGCSEDIWNTLDMRKLDLN